MIALYYRGFTSLICRIQYHRDTIHRHSLTISRPLFLMDNGDYCFEGKGIHGSPPWIPRALIRNLSALSYASKKANFQPSSSLSLIPPPCQSMSVKRHLGSTWEAALIRRAATISIHGRKLTLCCSPRRRRYESARSRGDVDNLAEFVERLRQQPD